ncbi:hypothetical protein [Aquipuribacter hungaricus]|uniref:Uncharacterized protein n=1 Tax=Aquipuribacter hungaricus TaxID=545624 RepID=A0ABV7WE85_9MICO
MTTADRAPGGPSAGPGPSRRTRLVLVGAGSVAAVAAAAVGLSTLGGADGPVAAQPSPSTDASLPPSSPAPSVAPSPEATAGGTTAPAVADPAPSAAPDAAPTVAPAPGGATAPAEVATTADDAVQLFVRGTDLTLSAGGDGGDTGSPVPSVPAVAGPLLEELTTQLEEYDVNGWRQEGRTTVVSSEVLSQDATGQVLRVCVDSSDVRVVDEQGVLVQPTDGLRTRQAVQLTVQQTDGAWQVVRRDFPDDPDC